MADTTNKVLGGKAILEWHGGTHIIAIEIDIALV